MFHLFFTGQTPVLSISAVDFGSSLLVVWEYILLQPRDIQYSILCVRVGLVFFQRGIVLCYFPGWLGLNSSAPLYLRVVCSWFLRLCFSCCIYFSVLLSSIQGSTATISVHSQQPTLCPHKQIAEEFGLALQVPYI